MKLRFGILMFSLFIPICLSAANDPSPAERSVSLFSRALHSPDLAKAMGQLAGSEIISVRQIFILAGRGSHTNYEVRFGVPDGTGGYWSATCLALKLQRQTSDGSLESAPEETDDFIPAAEACRP